MMLTPQEQRRSRIHRRRRGRGWLLPQRCRTTVATSPAVVTNSALLSTVAVVVAVVVVATAGSSGVQALSMLASPSPTVATPRGASLSSRTTVVPDAAPKTTSATPLLPSWMDDVWREPSSQMPFPLSTVPSDDGIDIELPNFARILEEIRSVSPLANQVMSTTTSTVQSAASFPVNDDAYLPTIQHPWKLVENSYNQRTGQRLRIDKIDHYQGRMASAPLLRFRTHIKGPCIGECFAQFIMDHKYRSQWDAQIDQVYEAHSVSDHLSTVQQAMTVAHHQLAQEIAQSQQHTAIPDANNVIIPDWGTCSKFGVGYCKTKASIVSPREQLTLCGIQDYPDGSCLIWGVEMDQRRHDHLMPAATNQPGRGRSNAAARAKSHLFCTTLTPRPAISGPMSFDVEYLLQLEIGGKLPAWISGPVVTENVKQLLSCATNFFAGTDSQRGLETYLLERAAQAVEASASASAASDPTLSSTVLRPVETYMEGRHGLLMTF